MSFASMKFVTLIPKSAKSPWKTEVDGLESMLTARTPITIQTSTRETRVVAGPPPISNAAAVAVRYRPTVAFAATLAGIDHP